MVRIGPSHALVPAGTRMPAQTELTSWGDFPAHRLPANIVPSIQQGTAAYVAGMTRAALSCRDSADHYRARSKFAEGDLSAGIRHLDHARNHSSAWVRGIEIGDIFVSPDYVNVDLPIAHARMLLVAGREQEAETTLRTAIDRIGYMHPRKKHSWWTEPQMRMPVRSFSILRRELALVELRQWKFFEAGRVLEEVVREEEAEDRTMEAAAIERGASRDQFRSYGGSHWQRMQFLSEARALLGHVERWRVMEQHRATMQGALRIDHDPQLKRAAELEAALVRVSPTQSFETYRSIALELASVWLSTDQAWRLVTQEEPLLAHEYRPFPFHGMEGIGTGFSFDMQGFMSEVRVLQGLAAYGLHRHRQATYYFDLAWRTASLDGRWEYAAEHEGHVKQFEAVVDGSAWHSRLAPAASIMGRHFVGKGDALNDTGRSHAAAESWMIAFDLFQRAGDAEGLSLLEQRFADYDDGAHAYFLKAAMDALGTEGG